MIRGRRQGRRGPAHRESVHDPARPGWGGNSNTPVNCTVGTAKFPRADPLHHGDHVPGAASPPACPVVPCLHHLGGIPARRVPGSPPLERRRCSWPGPLRPPGRHPHRVGLPRRVLSDRSRGVRSRSQRCSTLGLPSPSIDAGIRAGAEAPAPAPGPVRSPAGGGPGRSPVQRPAPAPGCPSPQAPEHRADQME